MKSEFALAFNQICAEYNLPRDVVLEAFQAALVSAYRRDYPEKDNLTAKVNMDTGLARIYEEKLVVEEVEEPETQITLKEAKRLNSRANLGETVLIDVTPRDFGRIAAQTAKQVITQRLREAERESQYTRFSRQANEIIIGTVQSIKPHGITLHIERTEEAIMPRREQIPGERYSLHQKIRVYVLSVRKTPRGPEVIVSRSHPAMLRRLLELEVPEIRNGQVEVHAIAREAGTRSKVAVGTKQPGLDPVGACVGMRGIRIQTISRELNDERIDVVLWDPDPAKFIGNALSIDEVLSVVVGESESSGKTASVVVMDDVLSLAIGRSGQNARLAAKLTGWRIDIQGATEAALWALEEINKDPEILANSRDAAAFVPQLASIMATHERERYPYTAEERTVIRSVVDAVREAVFRREALERPGARQARARQAAQERLEAQRREAEEEARASVPEAAYEVPLAALELSEKVMGHLKRSDISNVGEVMERLALGDEGLLMLNGIGSKALSEIKEAVSVIAPQGEEGEERVVEAEVEAEEAAVEEVFVPKVETPEPKPEPEPAPTLELEPVEEENVAVVSTPFGEIEYYEEEEDELFEERASKSPKKKKKPKRRRPVVFDEDSDESYVVRRRKSGHESWDDYV
jgi:N utilization substance protein A